jgi:predicted P-loop ATPase
MTTDINQDNLTSPVESVEELWLTEIKHVIKVNPSLTTKQRVRVVLKLDPAFESLCHDVTKYQPMIDGAVLKDSDISIISSMLTDNYKNVVCTFTKERANDLSLNLVDECLKAVAYERPFNPRTKYVLDCYQEHGGRYVDMLDVWLEKVGCVIDDDKKPLLPAIGRKYFIQIIARIFHAGCQADMGLIFFEPHGDKAKSKLLRTLAVKPEWINETGIGDLKCEKKTGDLIAPYLFCAFDENSSLSRGELVALKKVWTLTKDTYRANYDKYASDKLRQTVFAGTQIFNSCFSMKVVSLEDFQLST